MEDKELIKRLASLKQIKPREDWVIFAKKRLFEQETLEEVLPLQKGRFFAIFELSSLFMKYLEKPAFVMPVLAVLVAGGLIWQVSTKSLPGDVLYPLKNAAEQASVTFSSEDEKPFMQIELTQRRLEDLKRIAESNQVRNLPAAIKAFEATISELSNSLDKIVENQPEKALQVGRVIVQLQEEKSKVEKTLGALLSGGEKGELDAGTQFVKEIVESVLAEDNSLLAEEQQALLREAEKLYERGEYHEAFEKVWLASIGS